MCVVLSVAILNGKDCNDDFFFSREIPNFQAKDKYLTRTRHSRSDVQKEVVWE